MEDSFASVVGEVNDFIREFPHATYIFKIVEKSKLLFRQPHSPGPCFRFSPKGSFGPSRRIEDGRVQHNGKRKGPEGSQTRIV